MSLSAGDRLGPYEVRAHLGSGGMGDVYCARDAKLHRDVALKVLPRDVAHDPDRMARFEREARLLASLSHPHIAAIHGFEESGSTRALVMELVEGPTLADRIAGGALPRDEAFELARQIADALEYAHDQGVIHRDLKPANVKITPEGAVKVLDFGLAKAIAPDASGAAAANATLSPTLTMDATQAGVILGTAAYMAPEQAKGRPATRRSDIWAFGVILFEMLTGRRLFAGDTVLETMAAVMKEPPDLARLPATTPPAIRGLIARCLEKDPRQRLQAIGEARIALSAPLQPAETTTAAPAAWRRLLWPAVAALLATALAALAFVHAGETPPVRQTLRYQIRLPEDRGGGFPTLSPDGRLLVFRAPSSGEPHLWIQGLDRLEARPLAGTTGAVYPFWSPDSAWVGFFADGQLKKIAVAGGPAIRLADVVEARGASWFGDGSRDGIIIYSAGPQSPVFRISSGGGTPEPVLQPVGTAEGYRFPWFLPDGVHFLVDYSTASAETRGVYVGSIRGGDPVRILEDQSSAIYVPSDERGGTGYVLFRRNDTTLMAQPFDADRLRIAGEAAPIADQVAMSGNFGFGAFSASATGILLYRVGIGEQDRQLVWMDRTGRRLDAVTPPGSFGNASISPDGTRVAFTRGAPGNSDLWVQDLAAASPSRLTFLGGFVQMGAWSPDGTSLAVAHSPTGFVRGLYRIPARGGREEQVHEAGVNTAVLDWSRDGRFLLFTETSDATGPDLFLLPMDGSGERTPVPYLQTRASESAARFSPDGRWMAYTSNESGQLHVYVQDIPATGRKYQVSTDPSRAPAWRADGRELFFVTASSNALFEAGSLMSVPVTLGDTFQHGAPRRLFTGATAVYSPSPDGQRFLVNVPAEGAQDAPPLTVVTNWQAALVK